MAAVSTPFLGLPYSLSPLGEGEGSHPDPDPRVRYDTFDCLTFVETVLALAMAPTPEAVLPILNDVRYGAGDGFVDRNHVMEAQWIPWNTQKGYLRNISRQVAGASTVTLTKRFVRSRREPPADLVRASLPLWAVPRGEYGLEAIPLSIMRRVLDRVPAGSILFVVRQDGHQRPTRVTHVGFVLDVQGRRIVRHASRRPSHRVVDEPLSDFVHRNEKFHRWPVDGFALYEVRLPLERLASAATGQPFPRVDPPPVTPVSRRPRRSRRPDEMASDRAAVEPVHELAGDADAEVDPAVAIPPAQR